MGEIAFVFPGQGAQYPGMGLGLYESNMAAREVFDMAEDIRPGVLELIFHGSIEDLTKTENTQPAMFCVELATAAALQNAGVSPKRLAGFSLGEITALTVSGAVTAPEGFRMVIRRAQLMQNASESAETSMAAVIKLDDGTVEGICHEFMNIFPVNYNYPGQVVVSGAVDELPLFGQRVKELGGRVVPLKVAGAFHSPYMKAAAEEFRKSASAFDIRAPGAPVYSNMTARPYSGDPIPLLGGQICSPVLWSGTILNMICDGVDTFIEAGPGKVLSGLISRISGEVRVYNAEDPDSLDKTVSEVLGIAKQ